MKRIRVVTWNAEGMFVAGTKTKRASPHDALAVVRKLDADIIVIPEFGRGAELRAEIKTSINALGYEMLAAPYHDSRAPELTFMLLTRLKVESMTTHPFAGSTRSFLEVICIDEEGERIRILGVHLDDRNEAIRMRQITSVVKVVNAQNNLPTLLMGDFNAMHKNSLFARTARSSVGAMASRLTKHELLTSMAQRVQEMAIGSTIDYLLAHTDLQDLDGKSRPTISAKQADLAWAPKIRLAKIDWIFGSQQWIPVRYTVYKDVGSDHRPVIADLHY